MSNETWNCPNCGKQEVTSNLCPNCGTKKPEAKKITLEEKKINQEPGKNEGPQENTGRLEADQQWYEKDPSLLAAEKAAMAKLFPNFKLEQIADGRLAWTGTLIPGIWKGFWAKNDSDRQTWEVMAIYDNNHPNQILGSSLKVFLLSPTIDFVIEQIGWCPSSLLRDHISGLLYLCTAHAEDINVGDTTTAAVVLRWAFKWLQAFELVMTGDLSREDYDGKKGYRGKLIGKRSVAQMTATAELGIGRMYERGLKQMESAKTKLEYLQAADIFQSLFNSLDTSKIPSSVDKNKCLELAKKCFALAEQCKDDDLRNCMEAKKWLKKAADQGFTEAQNLLEKI